MISGRRETDTAKPTMVPGLCPEAQGKEREAESRGPTEQRREKSRKGLEVAGRVSERRKLHRESSGNLGVPLLLSLTAVGAIS